MPDQQRTIARRREAVAILYADGKTQSEIAAMLNLSRKTVQRDVEELHRAVSGFEAYAAEQLLILQAAIRKAAGDADYRSIANLSAVARRWFANKPDAENDQPIVWRLYDDGDTVA